ncbi:tail length tape-measure protein [Lactococcus phage CHPC1175]|nr:tail length tape-measure protein [Lactococcus phage CHPC1175]
MADIMVDSVTTGIDLNETKAVEAINRLKSAEMLFLHQNIAMKVLVKQWKSKKLILLTFQKV